MAKKKLYNSNAKLIAAQDEEKQAVPPSELLNSKEEKVDMPVKKKSGGNIAA